MFSPPFLVLVNIILAEFGIYNIWTLEQKERFCTFPQNNTFYEGGKSEKKAVIKCKIVFLCPFLY
jgi:hypothetical protein